MYGEKKEYGAKSDIWSCGCILYEMCTNEIAFNGETDEEVKKAICAKDSPQLPDEYNAGLKKLLKK